MSWWVAIVKAIQLKARFLLGLWVLGGLILFMPSWVSERLCLGELRNVAGGWIGLATVGAFAFWLVQLWPWACGKYLTFRRRRETLKSIDSLNGNELFFVRYCLHKMHRTVYLSLGNAAGESLCQKGLIERARMGDRVAYPYTIPLHVWKNLLLKKAQLLPDSLLANPQVVAAFEDCTRRMNKELY
jgi:hypothetical protein